MPNGLERHPQDLVRVSIKLGPARPHAEPCRPTSGSVFKSGVQDSFGAFLVSLVKLNRWFWKYMYKRSRRSYQDAYEDRWGNDIKCVNCNEWYSLSGALYKHKMENMQFGFKTTCGQCGHVSYWNGEIAPVLVVCDDKGLPL